MRGILLVYAMIAAICFYFILQIFFGTYGIQAAQQTRQHVQELTAHINDLQGIQERIRDDLVSLQIDPQRIEEEARHIGYYDQRDVIIRYADQTLADQGNNFGQYLYSQSDLYADRRSIFRWLSFIFGLLCLIIFSLFDSAHSNERRESANYRSE